MNIVLSTMMGIFSWAALFLVLVWLSLWLIRRLHGSPAGLRWRDVLFLYCYVVLFIGIMLTAFGTARLGRTGITYPTQLEFSYAPDATGGLLSQLTAGTPLANLGPAGRNTDRQRVLEHQRNEDFANGESMLLIGLVIAFSHGLIQRDAGRRFGAPSEALGRLFWPLLLVTFGALTLAGMVEGLSNLIYYTTWSPEYSVGTGNSAISRWYTPGDGLSIGLVGLIGWVAVFIVLRRRVLAEAGPATPIDTPSAP